MLVDMFFAGVAVRKTAAAIGASKITVNEYYKILREGAKYRGPNSKEIVA